MTAVIGGVGALLVALGASVVARVPALPGALALVHTAPVLAGCAATALAPGDWTGSTLLAAGTGVLLASPCVLALPAPLWPTTAAPLTVGGALTATGTLTSVLGTPPSRAGAAVLTLLVVLSLAAPWIAMAQVPVRVTGTSTSAPVDAPVLAARVAHSHALVLALKAGSCTACLVLAPLLAAAAEDADLLLMVKPQFEVGKERLAHGGVVRDPGMHIESVLTVAARAHELGVGIDAVTASPLPGPAGNVEYFINLHAGRAGTAADLVGDALLAETDRAVAEGPAGRRTEGRQP